MPEEMSLAVFDPFKALAVKVQEEDAALQIDHTTIEGEKELRSWVRTVRGYRAGLEKIRVRAKAEALEYGRTVDGLAKELKFPFDTIITERMKPLDEIEDAKRKAAEAVVEGERVAKEKAEADRLADLERRENEAAAKEAELKAQQDAIDAKQREAEQAEREKRIAESAAQSAREEAEEKAQQEAQRIKDEAAKIAADLVAEEARIKAEVLAKQEREAKIEAKRVAGTAHRGKIHRVIEEFLRDYVLDAEASIITKELIDGNIPNVTINY